MAKRARLLLLPLLFFFLLQRSLHADGRFDLVGPRIDVRVTRGNETLPIASVPNLQPGDKIWLHPDLPPTQSVKYLLICVFLRGTTNPPPPDWFIRIETWDKKVRQEGYFVTVPPEAQQVVLFMAPETGGDFSTLRSAVQGRPGVFVRASQDLNEAGFEQARIEKYLASIRRVPPSDSADLQKHSDLLARTLALKPNEDCFKRPIDTQFTCLTQTGTQTLLDDGHGQTVVSALSNGPGSDFINQASTTSMAGGGLYSAYVGAIVDLVRIMSNLHTAQYQYIPAIAFPQDASLNLRLNTPPSFHNPKSVIVIGLPSVQVAVPPPLRPADANYVACLIKPSVVLPIEGAPLAFSTDFAHEVVLHLNPPPGAPAEPDIPLIADAYQGGLVLQQTPVHHRELRDPKLLKPEPAPSTAEPAETPATKPEEAKAPPPLPQPKPVLITGTIQGRWGFDPFTGPTVTLQQLPGTGWHIVDSTEAASNTSLIAGRSSQLIISSTGSACIHTITAHPTDSTTDMPIEFKHTPKPDDVNLVDLSLPLQHAETPGDLHLAIQQYGQPKTDDLAARTFSEPAHIASIELHAGDRSVLLNGTSLAQVAKLTLGDLTFSPTSPTADDLTSSTTLRLALASDAPPPPTHVDDHLTARIRLHDGRVLSVPVTVSAARPVITLLHKSGIGSLDSPISLTNSNDLPLSQAVSFTLKSPGPFPHNGQIEIETLDGTLRTVLTLAPSGGLLLQDPHTVVATLDPLRSFGPSAFGPLHLRAVYPLATTPHNRHGNEPDTAALAHVVSTDTPAQATATAPSPNDPAAADNVAPEAPTSDWLPLGSLVRLPALTGLQCPTDTTLACTLNGSNLFLIESISIDPTFASPIAVPDGYTGTSLTLPHPSASTIFLHLRDDPTAINPAIVPAVAPPATVSSHTHSASHGEPKAQTQTPKETSKGPA
jgi:hypothetical protein